MCPYYASYKEVSRKIPHAVSGNTSWDILRAAISQYFSSISIPIALRPKSLAARKVVPLPMKGSRMVSPDSDARSTSQTIILIGFGHGWPFTSA